MILRFIMRSYFVVVATLCTTVFTSLAQAQGIYLTGVGPVNRSMGGAGTAAPLDAMGALYWNPASISALPCNEIGFGLELLLADIKLGTNIGSTTSGEAGAVPIPSIGWVHHIDDTPITIGLGLYGYAGFKNNMPTDPTNPLLAAGPAYAAADLLQIAPTMSYALTDRLSIGVTPIISTGSLTLDPLGPPVLPAITPGQGNRMAWGGGFQIGAYYIPRDNWHLGMSYRSQLWFEDFRFNTPTGVAKFNLDLPSILSLGLAYSGFQNWTFAFDARYINYDDTPGFSQLGWSNVFAGAVGAQCKLSERLTGRVGYNFNQNPIKSNAVALNLFSPLIQNQNVAAGFTYRFASNVDLNMSYVYLAKNSVTGPLPFAPGLTATHELSAHSAILGLTVRY